MIAFSSIVTCPASCVPFEMITPSPTWQSCARCTYDMMKQFFPTVVLNDCVVPRLIVVYSRIDRAVADLDRRLLALELEILRIAAEHRADADLHVRRRA